MYMYCIQKAEYRQKRVRPLRRQERMEFGRPRYYCSNRETYFLSTFQLKMIIHMHHGLDE